MNEEKDPINIVSFLWYGDRWDSNDMGLKYVETLHAMISRNLSLPFKFICFTNLSLPIVEGIEYRLFAPPSWKGCLPRLWMYSPEAQLEGQVLALDLDIIITGSLDDIASYRGEFCVRSKFQQGEEHKADGDIIGFRSGARKNLWDKFTQDPQRVEASTGGRERYYYRAADECKDRWQNLYPGQIISYKRHVKGKGLPRNARIVSCHGNPRPHEINEKWAKENWRI